MEKEEPELSGTTFSLETSLELINRPWVGRGLGSLPATPTHLLACPLERSGRETPMSVDSLPLEWDHTGDVGGSSSHEDDEEDEEEEEGDDEEERAYFSALSGRFTTLCGLLGSSHRNQAVKFNPHVCSRNAVNVSDILHSTTI